MGYIIAFILGIMVATIGFSGVAGVVDRGVQKVQEVTKEATK